jgi:hypothetical protein
LVCGFSANAPECIECKTWRRIILYEIPIATHGEAVVFHGILDATRVIFISSKRGGKTPWAPGGNSLGRSFRGHQFSRDVPVIDIGEAAFDSFPSLDVEDD